MYTNANYPGSVIDQPRHWVEIRWLEEVKTKNVTKSSVEIEFQAMAQEPLWYNWELFQMILKWHLKNLWLFIVIINQLLALLTVQFSMIGSST